MATYKFSPGTRFEVCKIDPDKDAGNIGRVFEIVDVVLAQRDQRKLIVWRWVPDHKKYEDDRDGGTSNEDWFIEKLSSGQIASYVEQFFDKRSSRLDEIE